MEEERYLTELTARVVKPLIKIANKAPGVIGTRIFLEALKVIDELEDQELSINILAKLVEEENVRSWTLPVLKEKANIATGIPLEELGIRYLKEKALEAIKPTEKPETPTEEGATPDESMRVI